MSGPYISDPTNDLGIQSIIAAVELEIFTMLSLGKQMTGKKCGSNGIFALTSKVLQWIDPMKLDIVEIMYIPLKIGDSKTGLPKVEAPSLIDNLKVLLNMFRDLGIGK